MNTPYLKGACMLVNRRLKYGIPVQFKYDEDSTLFEDYLLAKMNSGLKGITIINDLHSIIAFIRWLEVDRKSLYQCTAEDVIEYLDLCQKSQNWRPSTAARNAYQLKAFLNWLFENEKILFSGNQAIPRVEPVRRSSIRSFYTSEEISRFMDTFDVSTPKGKEEYLLICLIVYLGLRISDVVYLKLTDINFDSRTISVVQFKTGRYLSLPLVDELLVPLGDYLMNCRPADADIDYLFITEEKPYRLKEELRTHSQIVKKHLVMAGIDITNRKTGFHALRHSFATRQLENDTDIYSVSSMLGHSSVNVTDVYLDVDTSKLKQLALEVPYVTGI
ncbi:MAG: tyrosine-type recombinase/integrase [Faecalicoccus sp.]|nr:tyrosine-type recombinase/integrase [Faecalicoccus sp.]